MIFVACSGFPVPVSRYWREFPAVEITETELGLPGEGSVRRWVREAPADYVFTLRAPQEIAAGAFEMHKEARKLVDGIGKLALTMDARAIVFLAAEGFKPTRISKQAIRDFVAALPAKYPPVVLDLPLWTPDQIAALAGNRKVFAAYDPLMHEAPPTAALTYIRLPGPAGHRSRYDETALTRVAEHCAERQAETLICVFRNIDMHANATSLRKKLAQ